MAMMPYFVASQAVPESRMIRVPMMMVRVRCAFLARGSRKAMTPLETASTPVMAAQPLEKAFIRSQMLR